MVDLDYWTIYDSIMAIKHVSLVFFWVKHNHNSTRELFCWQYGNLFYLQTANNQHKMFRTYLSGNKECIWKWPGYVRGNQWANLQKYISRVRTNILTWDVCILVENIHVKFWNICSEFARQLTECLQICPRGQGRVYCNYITMDHTHLGDLNLHRNVYFSI